MKFVDFEVYDDNDNLVETLPAILYLSGNQIIAQVPLGTASVNFTAILTGQTTTETVMNGIAVFTPTSNDTYRVGDSTISGHNQVTVTGIQTLGDVKQEKLTELETAFAGSFSTFQSAALGTTKTYPADAAAVQNLQYYVNLLASNPNKSTVYFKTVEDGKPVLHTRTQFFQVLDDFETFDVNRTTKFDNKAAQVNASLDIPTVQSIVWNDTAPPATPTGLTATSPSTGEITANWTKNTEIDVTYGGSYNVYLTDTTANTAPVKSSVTTNTDTLTGLTSGHVYSIAISAVDSDGNESAQSATVSVTVL